MIGFDSRAAMVPGGAAEGFGNLASALLLAPQIHRRDQMEAARFQAEQQARKDQLAQALLIAKMQDDRERGRWSDQAKWHQDEIDRQKANDTARNGVAASDDARKWAGTIGQGALNLAGALGLDQSKDAKKSKYGEYKPDLYNVTETIDPDTGKLIRTRSLKTPDQIDQERSLYDRATLGAAVNGKAPTPTSDAVATNKARSAQVRADQQTQGLASSPGKPAPAPSTAGVGEVMPSGTGDAPAPAVDPRATGTAIAPTLTRAHLMSKVGQGPGMFPTIDAAYQDATSRGYAIADM